TPRELYAAPASRFVAEFIGEANLLTAEIVAHDGGLARTRLGPILLDLPHRDQAVGPALVAVRPEAIRLVTPETGSMAGTVAKAAYLGSHMEYAVTTAVGELFVIDRDVTRPHRPGAGVGIVLDPEGATLVPA
ncbi:MAG: TOBE domain-containing protein, partial [Alphaproteobacteria bacterium]|nr:TOBE domain-containing protein [Alphaproteobacteria bacterium]